MFTLTLSKFSLENKFILPLMNSLDFISLRRNCTNRFVKSYGPTPSEDAFLLTDFSSSEFVDKVMKSYQCTISEENVDVQLNSIIHNIELGFTALQEELNSIKSVLMSKAYSLFGSNRHSLEIDRLGVELRVSHQKVLKNKLDSKLVEEFVVIFNHFKDTILNTPKSVSSNIIMSFHELSNDIQRQIKKSLEICTEKALKDIISMPEIIPEKVSSYPKTYKPKELFQHNGKSLQGCLLELEGRSSLLCFSYNRKIDAEHSRSKLYAIEKGKPCYSIPNCDQLPHAYSKRLNCLAFCYTRYQEASKNLVID